MKPVGKLVLVEPDKVPDTYENGLLKVTKTKANTGIIKAVSQDYPFPLKVGDRVYYINTHQEEVDGCVLIRADEEGAVLFKFNERV
jgi:co-chaperonin GroES (HSP10)